MISDISETPKDQFSHSEIRLLDFSPIFQLGREFNKEDCNTSYTIDWSDGMLNGFQLWSNIKIIVPGTLSFCWSSLLITPLFLCRKGDKGLC